MFSGMAAPLIRDAGSAENLENREAAQPDFRLRGF